MFSSTKKEKKLNKESKNIKRIKKKKDKNHYFSVSLSRFPPFLIVFCFASGHKGFGCCDAPCPQTNDWCPRAVSSPLLSVSKSEGAAAQIPDFLFLICFFSSFFPLFYFFPPLSLPKLNCDVTQRATRNLISTVIARTLFSPSLPSPPLLNSYLCPTAKCNGHKISRDIRPLFL